MSSLILEVTEKKELHGLNKEVVEEVISNYLQKHGLREENLSKGDRKLVIKEIRAQLRRASGMFHKNSGKEQKLFEQGDFEALLKTHASSAERIEDYPFLQELLKQLNAQSILDIGCGINPLALAKKGMHYYALDINEEEVNMVMQFFEQKGIEGEAIAQDARKIKRGQFEKVDVCLLFKVLDLLGKQRVRAFAEILENVEAEHWIISFPTKTLSGKSMEHKKRPWVERVLIKAGFSFKVITRANEIYYVAELPA